MTPEEFNAIWAEADAAGTMTPPAPAPQAKPAPSIDQIRKAFMRAKKALQDANAEGDKERAAKIRPDFIVLRDMLAEAKASGQQDAEAQLATAMTKIKALEDEVRALKVSRNDWKFKHDVLQDEVRTLRNPAPPMTANIIQLPKIEMDEEALEADYQRFFAQLDEHGAELRRQGRV